MRGWLWGLVAVLGAALAGIVVGIVAETPKALYASARYSIRVALGLAKHWEPVPGAAQAAGRTPKPCPDAATTLVIVTGGQSNAANVNPVPSRAAGDVSVWFEGQCFAAEDPILGADGKGGSLWPLLGDRLAGSLGRPVLLINGALGGTQFADWLDPRSGYLAALSMRVKAARLAGFEPDLILWHQGETDAVAESDMERLRANMTALLDRLLDEMPEAQLYLFRASKCIGAHRADGVASVREIQTSIADADPRVALGMNTDILGNDYRWDTCHFNSLGRTAIIDAIVPDLIALVKDPGAGRP